MNQNHNIVSLCSKGNWHFFLKSNCHDFVYLSFSLSHNDVPRGTNITYEAPVEIRIPITVWREIISSWDRTDWSKDLKMDNVTMFGKKILNDIIKSQK